jgi:ABC-type amino acid transport system permease subunit
MTIGNVIRAANHWQRGCRDWQIFDVPASADQYLTAVLKSAKILATRIDRQADSALIESARHHLISDAQAYITSRQPAAAEASQAPRRGFWHTVGLCIIAVIGGLIVGSIAGKLARSQTGGYVLRSAVRCLIYKGVGALAR